jgi:predicted Zn-dependent protease
MAEAKRWAALYDGGMGPRPAEVWFGAEGLVIDGVGVWAYPSIRLARAREPGAMRLEAVGPRPGFVTVADPAFRNEVARLFPALLAGSRGGAHSAARIALLVGGGILLVAALWVWALPALVVAGASLVPVAVEEQLGESVAAALAPESRRCQDPGVLAAVDRIVRTLERTAPSPYRYRVFVLDDPVVNAFAAPGGFVVVHRGLLERTTSPEDLAGVLAHEMQHVIQRHSVRAMLRSLGIRVFAAWVLGDAGALASLGAELGEMAYMRGDETSADREGMRMLQRARIDPNGLVRLMGILQAESGGEIGAMRYFSTHPASAERAAAMRALAAEATYAPRALLPGVAWPPSLAACRGARRSRSGAPDGAAAR